jgi:hypothetical protein
MNREGAAPVAISLSDRREARPVAQGALTKMAEVEKT